MAATSAAIAAGDTITITVTDEGAGTSTTYNDPQRYYKPPATRSDKLTAGQIYVARGAPKGVVVSVKEKHGSFRAAVPCMPFPMAVICCVLNIFTPGIGTLISAFTVLCCGYTETSPCKAFFWNILAGLLQAVTFIFIFGWIWSISWGMTYVQLSEEYQHEKSRRKHKYAPAPT